MALLSRIPHRRHRAERERHMPTPTVRIAVNADEQVAVVASEIADGLGQDELAVG